jgi:hypothetical protein
MTFGQPHFFSLCEMNAGIWRYRSIVSWLQTIILSNPMSSLKGMYSMEFMWIYE